MNGGDIVVWYNCRQSLFNGTIFVYNKTLDVAHNSFATRLKVRSERKCGIGNQITNKTSNA
jgi:hypothetical protein